MYSKLAKNWHADFEIAKALDEKNRRQADEQSKFFKDVESDCFSVLESKDLGIGESSIADACKFLISNFVENRNCGRLVTFKLTVKQSEYLLSDMVSILTERVK